MKRGQGLPMSTIVIAIIVLVVLVLLILFFTGGTGKIGEKIAAVFQGSTGGDDMASSIQFCKGYCEKAKLLTSDEEKSNSPFCQKSFLIDTDGDGEAQFVQASNPKKYYKYFCTS